MALEPELSQRTIAISETNVGATEFVLKVELIRCGPIVQYKTKNSEGTVQRLIFVDEEGTKIQAALFGELTAKWQAILQASKVYYVINGRIKRVLGAYNNVNKFRELAITQFTEIRECTSGFQTLGLSNGFSPFNNVEHMDRELQHDVIGIFLESSGLKESGGSKRRVVVITNESHERVPVTLWGEHADHDGLCLELAEAGKSVVAFCNVRISEFKGWVGFVSTGNTSILLNPQIARAEQLLEWSHNMIAHDVDISLTPSNQMRRAAEMKLSEILDSSHEKPSICCWKWILHSWCSYR